jgi:hypothetical protein
MWGNPDYLHRRRLWCSRPGAILSRFEGPGASIWGVCYVREDLNRSLAHLATYLAT